MQENVLKKAAEQKKVAEQSLEAEKVSSQIVIIIRHSTIKEYLLVDIEFLV